MTRITRVVGLLLCLAASGVSTGALAQTIRIWSRQPMSTNTVYKYTCGSPLTVSSPTNDGRTARVTFMNTDQSEVAITASALSEIDLALRLIKCVCFKPGNGFYKVSFSEIFPSAGRGQQSYGVSSAADFIRVNQSLCKP